MTLLTLIEEFGSAPEPWMEGRTIPWDEPAFSARMLAQHLSQGHDRASRRVSLIDRHVKFLLEEIGLTRGTRVLDLGCGPGLYAHRLAAAGCSCIGIDIGPASIEFARQQAATEGLDCRFELGDILATPFGEDHDLVLLLYGELNPFQREDALLLLKRCREALAPEGRLVLEVHSFDLVKRRGLSQPALSVAQKGLFSDLPHLRVDESFWHEEPRIACGRHWIVDGATSQVTKYGWSMQAYDDAEYESLLAAAHLQFETYLPSLTGDDDGSGFPVLIARRFS
jgi:SAM-dependent methyltransferase